MTAVDELIEKGAAGLEHLSARFAGEDGLKGRLHDELAEDAVFLRKLKPSAISARAHGETPPEGTAVGGAATDAAAAPTVVTAPPREGASKAGAGPNPVVLIAGAFAAGRVLAKAVDWRGHAYPRY